MEKIIFMVSIIFCTIISSLFYIGFLYFTLNNYGLEYLLIVLNPLNIWNNIVFLIIYTPSLLLIFYYIESNKKKITQ